METSRILELSSIISDSTKYIHAALAGKGLPSPSFDADAVATLPEEVSAARDALLDATAELHDLFLEPMDLLFRHGAVRPRQREL